MRIWKVFMVMYLMVSLGVWSATAAQSPQIPLAGNAIPKFSQPLPLLSAAGGSMATVSGNGALTIRMCEFDAQVLPPPMPATRVWGYIAGECPTSVQETYIGPVIVNARATAAVQSPTSLTFVNNLPTGGDTQVLAWKYSTDQTLHWADPLGVEDMGKESNICNKDAMMGMVPGVGTNCAKNYDGPVPGVVHLHGGEVPPEIDGGPDAWITSGSGITGHGYYTSTVSGDSTPANGAIYRYPNTQEASPIWFHDHALGITRLNVYAGLAGAYLIYDPNLVLPAGLHFAGLKRGSVVDYTVPIVLQDRMFDTNGQLFMQADSAGGFLWATNPQHPYWTPEFVGDTIVVNGKAWPYLNVEPKRYRFWFINGSNARTYEMFLIDPLGVAVPPLMWVIATDGGYLDKPVKVKKLVMMPGERYEVIVDFAGVAPGTNLVLKNTAKTPFPGGATPQGATLGQIMQFRVGACATNQCGVADTSYNPAGLSALRPPMVRLVNPATGTLAVTVQKTRQLTLNEVMGMPVTTTDPVTGLLTAYPGGPLEILVNNTTWSGGSDRSYGDFTDISVGGITTKYSEIPREGETEVWEIVNLTADAHPIHLHLVQFQLMNREVFNVQAYSAAYGLAFPSGAFQPGFGPPCNYNQSGVGSCNTRALGGNPDIAAVGKNGKPLYLSGKVSPPAPNEAGWKDTVVMYPGQVTRIAVRWAPTDLPASTAPADAFYPFDPSGNGRHGYVWHCHIIDHEDNEMMRPTSVTPNEGVPRTVVKGSNY
jgi:spore coat protein A, manganese oxidase